MICRARIPGRSSSLNFNRSPIFIVFLTLFSAILLTACAEQQEELPEARVAAIVTEGPSPLTVEFTNDSKNANEFVWNFGDGADSETTSNRKDKVTHEYTKAGEHKVTLTAIFRQTEEEKRPETSTDRVIITVKPGTLDSVTVQPATAEAGKVHEFTPAAFDQFGNPISGLTYVYSADDAAGVVDGDGRFTAGTKVGVYESAVTVKVTEGTFTQTTAASVTIVPGPLHRLSLEPSELTLEVTEQMQFTATASDQFDNSLSGVTYVYTADQQAGQMDQEGLFKPGTILGTYPKGITVGATQGEVTRSTSAQVSLVPGPRGIVSWWAGDGDASDIAGHNQGSIRTIFQNDGTLVSLGAGIEGTADRPTAFSLFFDRDDRLMAFFEREDGKDVELMGPAVSDSDFHHYAYVRSGHIHKLLLDGVVVALGFFTDFPGDATGSPLVIGARKDDQCPGFCGHFGGLIDEVAIFNRALSIEEIETIHKAGGGGKIKP